MAQQTALSVLGIPGPVHAFVAKDAAPVVEEEVEAVVGSGRPAPPLPQFPVGPVADKSFPMEAFNRAIDNEAQKQRSVINQAYKEALQDAEELEQQARYARDEALVNININLQHTQQRIAQLEDARRDVRRMQTRKRLEEARKNIGMPKPKKRKPLTPKATRDKLKQARKKYQ